MQVLINETFFLFLIIPPQATLLFYLCLNSVVTHAKQFINIERGFKKNSEKELIQAVKAGKSEAITFLFHEYGSKLMGICDRYAPDKDAAKDLFQEGFLKILKIIDSFRYESKLESWLYRIMVNHCINAIRKRKKDIEWVELKEDHSQYVEEEIEIEDPQLRINQIMELMNQLPYGYRLVLNMYAVDNRTHAEIAKELGISVSTSKTQLFKARRYLLNLIKNIEK